MSAPRTPASAPLAVALVLCGSMAVCPGRAAPEKVQAPSPSAPIVNQLRFSGNACGPAALLTAFSLGSPRWQEINRQLPATTDAARMRHVIEVYGGRPSRFLTGRARWQQRTGISLVDLTDIANEMRGPRRLPELEWQVLLPHKKESPRGLLRRTQAALAGSLRRGFPPVLGVQRLARRDQAGAPSWVTVYGHFIVVTALPRRLNRGEDTIPFQYADPWGGVLRTGHLRLDTRNGFTTIVAEIPGSQVGARFLRDGEQSLVIVSSGLGDF